MVPYTQDLFTIFFFQVYVIELLKHLQIRYINYYNTEEIFFFNINEWILANFFLFALEGEF